MPESANFESVGPVKLSGSYKHETVLLEPSEDLHALMLAGSGCLVTTKNHKASLTIMNPTQQDITLCQTTVVANVNLIDLAEIYSLGNDTDCNVLNVEIDSMKCKSKGKQFDSNIENGN